MGDRHAPLRVVTAVAPIRICDIGGWTDTWFAGHGKVFNIGVAPYAEVQVKVHPRGSLPAQVVLDARNYNERYGFGPGELPGRHPLLEAAIDEIGVPWDAALEISVFSKAPAGSSTGTSASVTVALIGALDAVGSSRLTPHEVASVAHRVETERLGAQSGIQDQLCAAYGGVNFIEMPSYPSATVTQLPVPDDLGRELEQHLVLVFLGHAHVSSQVHEQVITDLESASPALDELRRAAEDARDAVLRSDLAALGRAMTRNTDAQRSLHAALVSADARRAIEVATAHGALGCKVNGAGGEGGSITVLCGRDKHELVRALAPFRVIPTRLSRHGLRVRDA
jgi:D-glycero-alpha-D-manno-heptose-7-phosphate kinase